jgi:hypothetical protein
MENLKVFEIEDLEPRFEFRAAGDFWSNLWDGICWFAESVWDIFQTLWETASVTVGYNFPSDVTTGGISFKDFFATLGTNWTETYNEYYGIAE